MQERWRIEMLGWLRITRRDRVITRSRTQKAGALLAYLAYHAHRSHPRECLIELLWPECEPEAGRNRLSVALSSLRRQLEPPGVAAGAVVQANHNSVQLNAAAFTTDVAQFEAAMRAVQQTTGPERILRLERAVGFYRGELLPGYFEEWIVLERDRLAELYLHGLAELMAACEQEGDLHQALQWARRAVSAEPLREEAHAALIRLLATTGQEGAAVRQYGELERLLSEALGVQPAPETRALVADLCDGDSASLAHSVALPSPRQFLPLPALAKGPSEVASVTDRHPEPLPRSAGHLPPQLTRFFGREREIARLRELLTAGARLVTLTGPGGSGKTRLAMAVAARLRELLAGAVWFVPLQDVTDPRLVIDRLHDAMELSRTAEVEPRQQVLASLRRQPALVLMDNVEQLGEAGAMELQSLLEQVEHLTLLVTSRRALNLPGEQRHPVGPLPVPVNGPHPWVNTGGVVPRDWGWQGGEASSEKSYNRVTLEEQARVHSDLGTLTSVASVQLFMDRAQAIRPDFQMTDRNAAAVAGLCARLEGLPLAIELAAARVGVLTPQQMLEHLKEPFTLLVTRRRMGDCRHRSLWTALEWSYRLLTPELQQFFARLSVFRGGWTLEAAREVCQEPQALEYLEELRECSLVLAEECDGAMRYRLLESLREFGAEQLAPEQRAALSEQHVAYFTRLAYRASAEGAGTKAAVTYRQFLQETSNLRAALAYLLASGQGDAGIDLTEKLRCWLWEWHPEGRDWLQAFLDLPEGCVDPEKRYDTQNELGWFAYSHGDFAAARRYFEANLSWARGQDRQDKVIDLNGAFAMLAMRERSYEEAWRLLEEALAFYQQQGDTPAAYRTRKDLAEVAIERGDYVKAAALLEECLQYARREYRGVTLADWLKSVGSLYWGRPCNYARARPLLEEAIAIYRDEDRAADTCHTLGRLAILESEQGAFDRARALLMERLVLARQAGLPDPFTLWLELGELELREHNYDAAREHIDQGLPHVREFQDRGWLGLVLGRLAEAACGQEDWPAARAALVEAQTLRHEVDNQRGMASCFEEVGEALLARGHARATLLMLAVAETLRESGRAPRPPHKQPRFEAHLTACRTALGDAAFTDAWEAGRAMIWREVIAAALPPESR